jgi:hypothetical protein
MIRETLTSVPVRCRSLERTPTPMCSSRTQPIVFRIYEFKPQPRSRVVERGTGLDRFQLKGRRSFDSSFVG